MAYTFNPFKSRSAFANKPNSQIPAIGLFSSFIYFGYLPMYLIPCIYLLKFSSKAKNAILGNNSSLSGKTFKNHKTMYPFMGIFTIITSAAYVVFSDF